MGAAGAGLPGGAGHLFLRCTGSSGSSRMSKRCCGRWSRRAVAEGSFPCRFLPDEPNGGGRRGGDHASYASEEGVRMSVKIRLMRRGAKGQPFYRLVIADARSPRSGKYIEAVGFYNPRTEPSTMKVDEEKVIAWLRKGARPSDAARVILEKTGVLQRWEETRARAAR